MRIYRLHMNGDFGHCDSKAVWFADKRDAPRLRRELRDSLTLGDDPAARPAPELEAFDVPTTKAALVEWLNDWCDR